MASFTGWALLDMINANIKASAALKWPITKGVIYSSSVVRGCKYNIHYLPSIRYQYTIEQKEYYGKHIRFGSTGCKSEEQAIKITKQYPEGKSVDVYYDPENPEESVLNAGTTAEGTLPLIIMTLLALMVIVPIVLYCFKKAFFSTPNEIGRSWP